MESFLQKGSQYLQLNGNALAEPAATLGVQQHRPQDRGRLSTAKRSKAG